MNAKIKFITRLSLALLLTVNITGTSNGQQTGSFDASILFQGQQRTLSFYVPPDYDSTQSYRLLLGLHGLGDNSNNMRNGIVSRGYPALLPHTIFVFPNGSSAGYFYSPIGYEAIIQQSLDYVKAHYHIDTTDIILEGFSMGGRNALKYGLQHYAQFKALLLNTPAIQGVMDAYTYIPLPGSVFAYQNADKIPIYITLGDNDLGYQAPVDSMYEQLVANNGRVRFFHIPGIGHLLPSITTSAMKGFPSFIDSPASITPDADLIKIKMEPRSCDQSVTAKC